MAGDLPGVWRKPRRKNNPAGVTLKSAVKPLASAMGISGVPFFCLKNI